MMKYGNDEWRTPNTRMERYMMDGKSHLFLKAVEDIIAHGELRYDHNGFGAGGKILGGGVQG